MLYLEKHSIKKGSITMIKFKRYDPEDSVLPGNTYLALDYLTM